jgi:hypothetical protein
MQRVILRAALAASLLCSAGVSQAADFIFSFGSDLSDPNVAQPPAVAGTVTGRILGLPEDGISGAPQIFVDSYSPDGTLAYPIDVSAWFSQFENEFTVSGGMIVAALFYADNNFEGGSLDQLYINYPIFESGGTNYASFGSNNEVSIWNNQGLSGITFTRITDPVPEPGTWAMMLLGFGAVGFALRRRRRIQPLSA